MKKVTVRAPVRADLAGGTLDLWPLYLFHPGSRTVNVAISYHAESEVAEISGGAVELHLTDQQYQQRYESLNELAADPKAALIHRVLEHFKTTGIRITTRTDAPRGSGLGGSSALTVTLVRALSEFTGAPTDGDDLVNLVRDLETRLLGVPAGIQDYYPPVYGGLAALHLNPGSVTRHPIPLPVERLAEHMLLHYTGVSHFSGTNNWDIYKRQIDKKTKVHLGLEKIAQSAMEMEKALESGNMEAAGVALGHEWKNRKALIDGISTPEIDQAIAAAIAAGAWAGKVCGAGGGGCIIFLFPPDRREAIRTALGTVPGKIVEAVPVAHGLTVERDEDTANSTTRRISRRRTTSFEQLWVYGPEGDYKPNVLAEAIVTHTEPRSGTRHAVSHTFVAPISADGSSVAWQEARRVDTSKLDLRAVPDPARSVAASVSPETLLQSAVQSQDAFRQHLAETERLQVFANQAFSLFSQPNESRDSFVERCLEEAKRRIEDDAERLEGTFRRRLDQVKERSVRDQREIDAQDEETGDQPRQDVNVAWGQALYNITSGKPAAVAEAPQSVREVDYMEKISQIQKVWEREFETIREGLLSDARSIEEISVSPSPKNIEITKYVILWAPSRF